MSITTVKVHITQDAKDDSGYHVAQAVAHLLTGLGCPGDITCEFEGYAAIRDPHDAIRSASSDGTLRVEILREAGKEPDKIVKPSRTQLVQRLSKSKAVPAKVAKKTKNKPTPKKSKPVPGSQAARAEAGRLEVLNGSRPPIQDAIAKVMGKDTMTAAEVLVEIQKRGWRPNSKDPLAYVAYTLSKSPRFERMVSKGKGMYRVRPATCPEAKSSKKHS